MPGSGVIGWTTGCVGIVDGVGEVSFTGCVLTLLQAVSNSASSKMNLSAFFIGSSSKD
jgi:hypothetical protein